MGSTRISIRHLPTTRLARAPPHPIRGSCLEEASAVVEIVGFRLLPAVAVLRPCQVGRLFETCHIPSYLTEHRSSGEQDPKFESTLRIALRMGCSASGASSVELRSVVSAAVLLTPEAIA